MTQLLLLFVIVAWALAYVRLRRKALLEIEGLRAAGNESNGYLRRAYLRIDELEKRLLREDAQAIGSVMGEIYPGESVVFTRENGAIKFVTRIFDN